MKTSIFLFNHQNQSEKSLKNRLAKIVGFAVIFLFSLTILSTLLPTGKNVAFADEIKVNGKAVYLVDSATGTEMYSSRSDDRLPIASMVKIMTTLLALESVDRGELSLDEMVPVSDVAASMGGSQVFLDSGKEYKAGELIKSIIVASANDSCVAMAERLSGSIEGFVKDMNERAKALGMNNTNFVNCTGLPAPESYSSAKDVSIMFRELIKHPKYFEYAGIWLEDFVHPDGRTTSMTNTNKLVRFYNGCDGGKTGFTSEAKFCLSATAERNGLRVVAVVIGADSSKERFASVSNLFGYAFSNYSAKVIQSKDDCIENSIRVLGGRENGISVAVKEDFKALVKKGDDGEYKVHFNLPATVKAPIVRGGEIGKAYLTRNGEVIGECPVVSMVDVEKARYSDTLKHICDEW